jgi:two-component SAPR family response regulator
MVIGFDANFCYLMQRYGRISAHQLVFADHNEDIIVQVRKSKPSVIFLEIVQSGSYMGSLVSDLKANSDTCHIPIVICSWLEDEHSRLQEKADIYLRLPILYENYKTALDEAGRYIEAKE